MSKSNKTGKVLAPIKIELADSLKLAIDRLKSDMQKTRDAIAGFNSNPATGGLLAAMQAEAANDTPEPELKQMGQWVFEGQDEKFVSAAMDADGDICLYECALKDLDKNEDAGHEYWYPTTLGETVIIGKVSGFPNWTTQSISRETVNDVDYLSDTPEDDDTALESPIFSDEELAEVFPQITQADMQLIFIKNLATTLIQRMHSMDRFSHDDYTIGGRGGDVMTPWDIIYDMTADRFGLITASEKEHYSAVFFKPLAITVDTPACFHKYSLLGGALRTITEDEITNFRGVLEAYYA